MPAAKPTLGYPSRTAAVAGLRAKGKTDRQIADLIGIPVTTVSALGCYENRRKRPAERNGRTVVFPNDVLERLQPQAVRRGVSVNELCRRLIETIANDDLFEAVLDEAVES